MSWMTIIGFLPIILSSFILVSNEMWNSKKILIATMYPSNGGKFDPRKPCTKKINSRVIGGKLYHEIRNLCLRTNNKF